MNELIPKEGIGALGKISREDWLPDPGVHQYVTDMLKDMGVLVDVLPKHWIPIVITGAMDWIRICQWWIPEFTGIMKSSEPYYWIFIWNSEYEFDPDRLLIFREFPEENKFEERFGNPGLDSKERSEAVPFIIQDIFAAWRQEPPPQDFVELTLYCTLMWVLSHYGKDWLYTVDPVISSIQDFGVAYYSLFPPPGLLDPRMMECTKREIGSCVICKESMHCVAGMHIDGTWVYMCQNCIVEEMNQGSRVDESDDRVRHPRCPQYGGPCNATSCPHHPDTEESIKRKFREAGSRRVAEYREKMRMNGGLQPRQLAGQRVEDLMEHYGVGHEDFGGEE